MNQPEPYSYWKRPWQKWAVFAAAMLQLIALWMQILNYRQIFAAGVLSHAQWGVFAARQTFQFAISLLIVGIFLGCFLIGAFVRSSKSARRAESILLLTLGLGWGVVGLVLPVMAQTATMLSWILLLVVTLGGSLLTFRLSRR